VCALPYTTAVPLSAAVDLLYVGVDVENMVVVRCRAVLVVAVLQHTVELLASVVAANGPPDTAAEGQLLAAEAATGRRRQRNRTTAQL